MGQLNSFFAFHLTNNFHRGHTIVTFSKEWAHDVITFHVSYARLPTFLKILTTQKCGNVGIIDLNKINDQKRLSYNKYLHKGTTNENVGK